jgi:hypothetical protein
MIYFVIGARLRQNRYGFDYGTLRKFLILKIFTRNILREIYSELCRALTINQPKGWSKVIFEYEKLISAFSSAEKQFLIGFSAKGGL